MGGGFTFGVPNAEFADFSGPGGPGLEASKPQMTCCSLDLAFSLLLPSFPCLHPLQALPFHLHWPLPSASCPPCAPSLSPFVLLMPPALCKPFPCGPCPLSSPSLVLPALCKPSLVALPSTKPSHVLTALCMSSPSVPLVPRPLQTLQPVFTTSPWHCSGIPHYKNNAAAVYPQRVSFLIYDNRLLLYGNRN